MLQAINFIVRVVVVVVLLFVKYLASSGRSFGLFLFVFYCKHYHTNPLEPVLRHTNLSTVFVRLQVTAMVRYISQCRIVYQNDCANLWPHQQCHSKQSVPPTPISLPKLLPYVAPYLGVQKPR